MSYFLLRQDSHEDYWSLMYIDGLRFYTLVTGTPVEAPAEPLHLTLGAWGREPCDFLELPCPAVSGAMRRVLDRVGVDNVQYFEAGVTMEHCGDPLPNYWLANIVGTVACVEDYDPESGTLDQGFRIDPTLARGAMMFRLAEDPRLIIVCERVADALRAADLRGVVLQDTQSFTGRRVSLLPPKERPPEEEYDEDEYEYDVADGLDAAGHR
jgi:hypothetical protein